MITVSIVSHGHGPMVTALIENLRSFPVVRQIITTLNIPEPFDGKPDEIVQIIHNVLPKGFGANHNYAFEFCSQPYFCVLNPDIEFEDDPFPELLNCLQKFNISLLAPIIVSSTGVSEDSARVFPTWLGLLNKLFFSFKGTWPLELDKSVNYPDWIAGMFMLFDSKKFRQIKGFDEKYFLYYEDVDICRRIKSSGNSVGLCTGAKVIHHARRTSRTNIKFMFWHIRSMFQYLFSKSF